MARQEPSKLQNISSPSLPATLVISNTIFYLFTCLLTLGGSNNFDRK
jgi:hypothetical protein